MAREELHDPLDSLYSRFSRSQQDIQAENNRKEAQNGELKAFDLSHAVQRSNTKTASSVPQNRCIKNNMSTCIALFWLKCASGAVEQPYHTAVQVGNMQDFSVQQVVRQPDHEGAQVTFPAATVFDVVQQAPRLLELLTPEGIKALTATCTQLRQDLSPP